MRSQTRILHSFARPHNGQAPAQPGRGPTTSPHYIVCNGQRDTGMGFALSIPDCMADARAVAERAARFLASRYM